MMAFMAGVVVRRRSGVAAFGEPLEQGQRPAGMATVQLGQGVARETQPKVDLDRGHAEALVAGDGNSRAEGFVPRHHFVERAVEHV